MKNVVPEQGQTFNECLLQTPWPNLEGALSRMFPDAEARLVDYHEAYQRLRATPPEANNMRILIDRFTPGGVLPFYVRGFNGHCPKGYCLKFIPWRRWLGARIDSQMHAQFTVAEISAICLNELCWAGFSAEAVEAFRCNFIHQGDALWAIYAHEEAIELSEFNMVKRKQRSDEFNEALNLFDIDHLFPDQNSSQQYRQAHFEMRVACYLLGETETDFETYRGKCDQLKNDFVQRWHHPVCEQTFIH